MTWALFFLAVPRLFHTARCRAFRLRDVSQAQYARQPPINCEGTLYIIKNFEFVFLNRVQI